MEPPTDKKLRVVVADDHHIVREGIVSIIDRQADMSVVAQAADGAAAVDEVLRHRPDVVLMDLRMPRMDGLEALQTLRREWPSCCSLVLTTFDADEDVHRAFAFGAKGYLLKSASSAQILNAIRTAAAGMRVVPQPIAAKLAEYTESTLTGRETAVLRLIACGRTTGDVAAALSISRETVRGHVKNIFSKLGAKHRTEAVGIALSRGLVRADELRR